MPQMMPLGWLMLYLFFSLMFMLFNIMNYYMYIPKYNPMNKLNMKTKMMNWMW